jgi:uncharacterized protein YciI
MPNDRLPTYYACIWRAAKPDETFDAAEFESRLPRLMTWLKDLRARGKLVACGGGGFETHSGGLTILRADSVEEALALAAGSPMNEIGKTDVLVWDVFFGDLSVPRDM